MNNCQSKQRYEGGAGPPGPQRESDLCEEEAADLTLREIRCPRCNFVIDKVFSDATGHFLSKCPKCKAQYIMNFAYFRRQKGIRHLKLKYYGDDYFEKMNSK